MSAVSLPRQASRLETLRLKLSTYQALGLMNVGRVASYRIAKRLGVYQRITPGGEILEGPVLYPQADTVTDLAAVVDYFSCHAIDFPAGPRWFWNPWRPAGDDRFDARHWSQISDFQEDIGDIKTVWELSRFDWAPKWAWQRQHAQAGAASPPLEGWIQHWCRSNPVNVGPNWKCGQETALRALNVLLAARIQGKLHEQPAPGLLRFLRTHVRRIRPSLRYAIGQDNNHGTSEAAALFIIGEYLQRKDSPRHRHEATRCARVGRRWLENRVRRLIMADGSFSQYSVTYHRLMLDTLSLVELLRVEMDVTPFSRYYVERMALAVQWLDSMIDRVSGDAPNLGANDGAHVFNVDSAAYRDFRPSLSLGHAAFGGASTVHDTLQEHQHPLLNLLPTNYPVSGQPRNAVDRLAANEPALGAMPVQLFDQGGYAKLSHGEVIAWLRLPMYRFRPSQSDALHLDVWCRGVNILRDGGSYCYNPEDPDVADFFTGVRSHNTARFDQRDQMPKISHFLIGGWLKPDSITIDPSRPRVTSAYTDHWGARHERSVVLSEVPYVISVQDKLQGFARSAEIRWRLVPGPWQLDEQAGRLDGPAACLSWQAPPGTLVELIEEPESRHYLQREMIPVLRVTLDQPGTVTTDITLKPEQAANIRQRCVRSWPLAPVYVDE